MNNLILQNLLRNKKNLFFASLGLVIGISSFVFFVALGSGVKAVVLEDIFVIRQIEVVPRSFDLAITQASFSKIDNKAIEKLAAIPGVIATYPKMKFTFPGWATGGQAVLGKNFRAEVIADGISTQLVKDDLKNSDEFRDWDADYTCIGEGSGPEVSCPISQRCIAQRCEKIRCNPRLPPNQSPCPAPAYCAADSATCEMPIPVIVNPMLLNVYNSGLTTALASGTGANLPKLSENAIVGFTFDIEFGISYLGDAKQGKPFTRRMQIVGFSSKALQIGFTIPLEYVKRLNAYFTGESKRNHYHSVILEAESNERVAQIIQDVKKLGFTIDDKHTNAERIALMISIVTLLFSLISFIIVAISAINIAHTFFMIIAERKIEIGILRALGASKANIRTMILAEASVLGLIGATMGIFLALLSAFLTNWLSANFLPDFPFKPDSFFLFESQIFIVAILAALIFCIIGAWIPASYAAKLDPARAFSNN